MNLQLHLIRNFGLLWHHVSQPLFIDFRIGKSIMGRVLHLNFIFPPHFLPPVNLHCVAFEICTVFGSFSALHSGELSYCPLLLTKLLESDCRSGGVQFK